MYCLVKILLHTRLTLLLHTRLTSYLMINTIFSGAIDYLLNHINKMATHLARVYRLSYATMRASFSLTKQNFLSR